MVRENWTNPASQILTSEISNWTVAKLESGVHFARAMPDHRGFHKDRLPFSPSNLRFRMSGFEMQDSCNFKICGAIHTFV
jgi:hypothetical protein